MGIISRIFGGGDTEKSIVDGIISGGDKIIYTKEERADNLKTFLELYHPFKIAQRLLMLIVVPPFVLMCVATFVSSFFIDVDKQIELLSGHLGWAAISIISFYTAGGAAEGVMKSFTKKRG